MTAISWLITGIAGLACSWIVSPPVSTAGRAAWTALVIGFLASIALMVFDHRAVLVIALPIAALSAPLAVIRRNRSGSQTQEIPAARGRVGVAVLGWLLFALGANVAALNNQSQWATSVLLLGAALVAGVLPFHRPSTETLRATPADIRAPAVLMLGPALWLVLARWTQPHWSGSLTTVLPLLTLWLGAFLVLARGDIPRLSSAALLYAAGQTATAAVHMPGTAMSVAAAVSAPLLLVVLLLSKLERNSETRDLFELGGLAQRLPRFSVAFAAAVFWFVGTAASTPIRTLIELATAGRPMTSAWRMLAELWPVYVPHVVALWGWTTVLRDLLVGPVRTPLFPEPLRDRVTMPPAERPVADLTIGELAAVIGFAVIAASV